MKLASWCHLAGIAIILLGTTTANAAPLHPVFTEESISDFSVALSTLPRQKSDVRVLDSKHLDRTQYRAYRFLQPNNVMIGVARNVLVDSSGHIVIQQEPGEPLGGRPNKTHLEYSHILVPVSVTLPR
ncbi:MAG: hypothetical protein QOJ39_1253 [Candidatus Eremiobacteraeota bacterium]|nr:hypothetical protein [Candidatus Eremiobacteraeota bacterium]MEA2719389.1 hypothetical protein [Candidatus Eremiobacteraeota bacterium]